LESFQKSAKRGKGTAGLELAMFTPWVVMFSDWVWGIATAMTIKFAKCKRQALYGYF